MNDAIKMTENIFRIKKTVLAGLLYLELFLMSECHKIVHVLTIIEVKQMLSLREDTIIMSFRNLCEKNMPFKIYICISMVIYLYSTVYYIIIRMRKLCGMIANEALICGK